MRYIKDILRLKLQQHHSHQHIASALGISKGVVAKYVKLASTAGLQWPQVQALDETALHTRLMGAPQRASSFVAPDYGYLHQELRRKGMTLMLLWQEHSERHPGASVHSYSQFCENYRRFAKTLKRSMRQVQRAGEKMFIDYCGPTVALTSGERAHIFVSARATRLPTPQPERAPPTGLKPPHKRCAFTAVVLSSSCPTTPRP